MAGASRSMAGCRRYSRSLSDHTISCVILLVVVDDRVISVGYLDDADVLLLSTSISLIKSKKAINCP